jgi:carbon storage regulator
MLVLSRKEGDTIHIGGGIVITVTQIKGNRVKIGIAAPPEVSVVRGEIKRSVEEFRGPLTDEKSVWSDAVPSMPEAVAH